MYECLAKRIADEATKARLDALSIPDTAYMGLLTLNNEAIEQEVRKGMLGDVVLRSFDEAEAELIEAAYITLRASGRLLKEVGECGGYKRVRIRIGGSRLKDFVRWNITDDRWPPVYIAAIWANERDVGFIRMAPIEADVLPWKPENGGSIYLDVI